MYSVSLYMFIHNVEIQIVDIPIYAIPLVFISIYTCCSAIYMYHKYMSAYTNSIINTSHRTNLIIFGNECRYSLDSY